MYKDLDALMPGSKFILTVRDPERWYESVARHIGDLRDPMHEWIYGRGKSLPKDDKAHTLNVYNRHNEAVMDNFKDRPNDLLVVDFTQGAGWDELCAFLGHPVPDTPFPHANNKRKESGAKPSLRRQLKVAKKRVKFAVQIAYLRGLSDGASDALQLGLSVGRLHAPSVVDGLRLEQHDPSFFIGDRLVFHAARAMTICLR